MVGMPAGRPALWTPELGQRVCDALAESRDGIRKVLEADSELPSIATVQQWLKNNAQFSAAYAYAKQQQLETLAEDIIDISRDASLDPNDKRVQIDALKWLLSKLIPKTYGDKLDVTSDGQALGVPAHQIDARVQSIIMVAQKRKQGELLEAIAGLDANALNLLN